MKRKAIVDLLVIVDDVLPILMHRTMLQDKQKSNLILVLYVEEETETVWYVVLNGQNMSSNIEKKAKVIPDKNTNANKNH